MKRLAIIWLSLAGLYAILATIIPLQPAAAIIDASTHSDGSFYVILPLGITFILLVLPLFPIMLINNFIQSRKNKLPKDLTGKTGLIITRSLELPNAAIMFDIYVNDNKHSKVGVGKSVFLELPAGKYQLQTKLGRKLYSAQLTIEIKPTTILAFETKTDINKSLTSLIPKGEMLFLVQVPFKK